MAARVSVLTIAQEAMQQMGLTPPTSLTNSTDALGSQLKSMLHTLGEDVLRRTRWQKLKRTGMILTAAAESQGDLLTLYPDFRGIVNDTMYNQTLDRKIWGPKSSQEWTAAKGMAWVVAPQQWWRIVDDVLYLYDQSTANETVTFEYFSDAWIKSNSADDRYSRIENDSHLCLLPTEMMKAGLVWRWKQQKGLEYSEEFRDFESFVKAWMAEDGGKEIVSLAPRHDRYNDPYPFDVSVPVGS